MEELERRLHEIERATNPAFVSELLRRIGASTVTLSGGSLAGTTVAVRNATDTGSELVADDYTGAIILTDNDGTQYTIGYY